MTSTHIPSWYSATAHPAPDHPQLRGAERADVVVLGAGIAGLSAAIELAERGYSVIVLEGERVGWGASGRSGGQAIFGYGCEMSKIAAQIGIDDARKLFDWSVEGVEMIAGRCQRYGIDCDLTPGHAHAAIKPRQVEELKHWQHDLVENYGYSGTELWGRARLQQTLASERYAALLYDPRSAHIHPLNYTLGLARAATADPDRRVAPGASHFLDRRVAPDASHFLDRRVAPDASDFLDRRVALGASASSVPHAQPPSTIRPGQVRIFENSRVTSINHDAGVVLRTEHGEARGNFGVVAGNAWLSGLVPQLEDRIMPVGTYICASQPLGAERARTLIRNNMAVADINFVLDYYRLSSDHRMLFGGRVSYSGIDPPALGPRMRARMHQVFPQLADVDIEHVWGGYVDISMSRAPHWGRIGANLYFAQGFSGHGIAAAGLAGRVIAEAIHGQSTRLDVYARIPHHTFPGGRALRMPALVLAMLWFRMKDWMP